APGRIDGNFAREARLDNHHQRGPPAGARGISQPQDRFGEAARRGALRHGHQLDPKTPPSPADTALAAPATPAVQAEPYVTKAIRRRLASATRSVAIVQGSHPVNHSNGFSGEFGSVL